MELETKHHESLVYEVYDHMKNYVREENAIKARDLAAQFNITERHLRDVMHTIRTSDELTRTIGSSPRGYFICKDKVEFERSNNTLYAAAFSYLKAARANEKKAGMDGQLKLKLGQFYQEEFHAFGDNL